MGQPKRIHRYTNNLLGGLRFNLRFLQGVQTVLQELLQNAEDAGSSGFYLDFCDDALYVGNDGVFEEEHFQAIMDIGAMQKRLNSETIGSFGVGFVSVYQITDNPELFSVGRHFTFDPLTTEIPEDDAPPPRPWNTVFRLPWAEDGSPLRTALESPALPKADMDQYIQEAIAGLLESSLFLRNIESITIGKNTGLVKRIEFDRSDTNIVVTVGEEELEYRIHTVPLTGNAARLCEQYGRRRSAGLTIARPVHWTPDFMGKFYAFLPTQESTGLPFHLNADFYPNTDRKRLMWEGIRGPDFNAAVLDLLADHVLLDDLLMDIRDTQGAEGLYPFLQELLESTRTYSRDLPLQHRNLLNKIHQKVALLVAKADLYYSSRGEWKRLDQFALLGVEVTEEQFDCIEPKMYSYLPPLEHAHFHRTLKAFGVGMVSGPEFVGAFIKLFDEKTFDDDTALGLLQVYVDRAQQETMDGTARLQAAYMRNPGEKFPFHYRSGELRGLKNRQGSWSPSSALVYLSSHQDALTALFSLEEQADREWLQRLPYFQRFVKDVDVDVVIERLQDLSPEQVHSTFAPDRAFLKLHAYLSLHPGKAQQVAQLPIFPNHNLTRFLPIADLAGPGEVSDPFHLKELIHRECLDAQPGWFRTLGLVRLNARDYLLKLLPEHFKRLTSDDQKIQVMQFLFDHFTFFMQVEGKRSWESLKCIRCTDGQWRLPEEVFWTNELMDRLLKKRYIQADPRMLGKDDVTRTVVRYLGVHEHPSPERIIQQLQLHLQAPLTQEQVEIRQALLKHLGSLEEPAQQAFAPLKTLAWLPDEHKLKWLRPSELYRKDFRSHMGAHIPAGTSYCPLDIPRRVDHFLGFRRPTLTQVSLQVQQLASENKPVLEEVLKWANGQLSPRGQPTDADWKEVRKWREWKILNTKDNRKEPRRFFHEDPKIGGYLYPMPLDISSQYPHLIKAWEVRQRPILEDYFKVIREVHLNAHQDEASLNVLLACWQGIIKLSEDLTDEQQGQVLAALHGEGLQQANIIPTSIKVPTTLVPLSRALYRGGWTVKRLEDLQVPQNRLIAPKLGNRRFWKLLQVLTVDEYVVRTGFQHEAPRLNDPWSQKVVSRFKSIIRVALSNRHRKSSEVQRLVNTLTSLQVCHCTSLVQFYHFKDRPSDQLQRTVDHLHEEKTNILYVAPAQRATVSMGVAALLGVSDNNALFALQAMLDQPVEEGERHLDELGYEPFPEDIELPALSVSVEFSEAYLTPDNSDDAPSKEIPSTPQEQVKTQEDTTIRVEKTVHVSAHDRSPPTRTEAGAQKDVGRQPENAGAEDEAPPARATTNGSSQNHRPVSQTSRTSFHKERVEAEDEDDVVVRQHTRSRPGHGASSMAFHQHTTRHYTEVLQDTSEGQQAHNKRIELLGMDLLSRYLDHQGWTYENVSHDTGLGYDVEVRPDNQPEFVIELKTVSGPWGSSMVMMTPKEVMTAYRKGDSYRLVVIECAETRPVMYHLPNPISSNVGMLIHEDWKERADVWELP